MKIQLFNSLVLTVAILTLSISSYSQKDTSVFNLVTSGTTGVSYQDSLVSITKWDDGRFEIRGDTLKAIRLLWKQLDKTNKENMDLYFFVGRAVDFTNSVPDYWKDNKHNKTWSKYYKELRKLGFKREVK